MHAITMSAFTRQNEVIALLVMEDQSPERDIAYDIVSLSVYRSLLYV